MLRGVLFPPHWAEMQYALQRRFESEQARARPRRRGRLAPVVAQPVPNAAAALLRTVDALRESVASEAAGIRQQLQHARAERRAQLAKWKPAPSAVFKRSASKGRQQVATLCKGALSDWLSLLGMAILLATVYRAPALVSSLRGVRCWRSVHCRVARQLREVPADMVMLLHLLVLSLSPSGRPTRCGCNGPICCSRVATCERRGRRSQDAARTCSASCVRGYACCSRHWSCGTRTSLCLRRSASASSSPSTSLASCSISPRACAAALGAMPTRTLVACTTGWRPSFGRECSPSHSSSSGTSHLLTPLALNTTNATVPPALPPAPLPPRTPLVLTESGALALPIATGGYLGCVLLLGLLSSALAVSSAGLLQKAAPRRVLRWTAANGFGLLRRKSVEWRMRRRPEREPLPDTTHTRQTPKCSK